MRYKHPVKRVSMMIWKCRKPGKIRNRDMEELKSVAIYFLFYIFNGPIKFQFAQADLDHNLPKAGNTDIIYRIVLLNNIPGFGRQLIIAGDEPNESMRIEKVSHEMYSLKSSKGSSKPFFILSRPLALPKVG